MSNKIFQPGDRIAVTDRTRAPMDETKGYRDHLLTKSYKAGDIVRVLSAFVGLGSPLGGMFQTDGSEGTYIVVGELALSKYSTGRDYKLTKLGKAGAGAWDIIVNTSRLERVS